MNDTTQAEIARLQLALTRESEAGDEAAVRATAMTTRALTAERAVVEQAHDIRVLTTKVADAYRARSNAHDLLTDALHAIANERTDAAIDLVERALVHIERIPKPGS